MRFCDSEIDAASIQRDHGVAHLDKLFPALADLHVATQQVEERRGGGLLPLAYDALQDLQEITAGTYRPSHEYLADPSEHSDHAMVEREKKRGRGHFAKRIVIDAEITSAGNFSATFFPGYSGPDGQVERGPEWASFDGVARREIAQRPKDEIMYVRHVQSLFHKFARENPNWGDHKPIENVAVALHHAFWLEVSRLRDRFKVEVLSHPTVLRDEQGKVIGFEIVNARLETFEALARYPSTVQNELGIDPKKFLDAADGLDAYQAGDKLSRKFRKSHPLARDLTPSAAKNCLETLRRAQAHGVWLPERGPASNWRSVAADAMRGYGVRNYQTEVEEEALETNAAPTP